MKVDDVTKEQAAAVSVTALVACLAAVWSLWGWQYAAIVLWLVLKLDEYIRPLLKRKP